MIRGKKWLKSWVIWLKFVSPSPKIKPCSALSPPGRQDHENAIFQEIQYFMYTVHVHALSLHSSEAISTVSRVYKPVCIVTSLIAKPGMESLGLSKE